MKIFVLQQEGELLYMCGKCAVVFTDCKLSKSHAKSVHENTPLEGFECSKCGYGPSTEDNVEPHVLAKHSRKRHSAEKKGNSASSHEKKKRTNVSSPEKTRTTVGSPEKKRTTVGSPEKMKTTVGSPEKTRTTVGSPERAKNPVGRPRKEKNTSNEVPVDKKRRATLDCQKIQVLQKDGKTLFKCGVCQFEDSGKIILLSLFVGLF